MCYYLAHSEWWQREIYQPYRRSNCLQPAPAVSKIVTYENYSCLKRRFLSRLRQTWQFFYALYQQCILLTPIVKPVTGISSVARQLASILLAWDLGTPTPQDVSVAKERRQGVYLWTTLPDLSSSCYLLRSSICFTSSHPITLHAITCIAAWSLVTRLACPIWSSSARWKQGLKWPYIFECYD